MKSVSIRQALEIMAKIINITTQPPVFFTADRLSIRERSERRFLAQRLARMRRSDRLRIARRLEWSADIVSYIERFIELPCVNLPSIKPLMISQI